MKTSPALSPKLRAPQGTPLPAPESSHPESQILELFCLLAETLGAPRSVGLLYGLLFATQQPLPSDTLASKLGLSAGSVSQGLKLLRNLGAIHKVYIPGDRRDFYAPQTGLRQVAGAFLRDRLEPRLRSLNDIIEQLSAQPTINGTSDPHLKSRIALLKQWHNRASKTLPLIFRLVG